MSQDRFGEATRRAFLGTATVATAATLTAAGRRRGSSRRYRSSRRHDQTGASERGCSRTANVAC